MICRSHTRSIARVLVIAFALSFAAKGDDIAADLRATLETLGKPDSRAALTEQLTQEQSRIKAELQAASGEAARSALQAELRAIDAALSAGPGIAVQHR